MGKVKEIFIEAGEELVNEGIANPTDSEVLERVKQKVALLEEINANKEADREKMYAYFDLIEDNGMEKAMHSQINKEYPDSNLDEIRSLAEEIHAAGEDATDVLFKKYSELSAEDQEYLNACLKEFGLEEEECDHNEVDPMEGCLDCGCPYHECRNTDPDFDMER